MKKILISGGNFVNKGAEAMLYITVNEMLTRFSGCVCVIQLSSGFYEVRSIENLNQLANKKIVAKGGKFQKLKNMLAAYHKADFMVDISGYEISSKLGVYPSLRYVFKIALSKWMKIPVYLMPQSFGPFEYKGKIKWLLNWAIRHYLSYPRICFAREKQSFSDLQTISPKARIQLSTDLVLQNASLIKEMQLEENDINIAQGSVGFVVNGRLYEQYDKDEIKKKYLHIINKLIENKRDVYLLCHASDDLNICWEIKMNFPNQDKVHVVNEVLSCFAFQRFAAFFKYVVAARYHSIVHAYKEGIPCVAMGWAVKYKELLENVGGGKADI